MPKGSTAQLEHVLRIKQAYGDLLPAYVPGADRIPQHAQQCDPGSPLKRDAVRGVIKIKSGSAPQAIVGKRGKCGRKGRKARTPEAIESLRKSIGRDNSTATNSSAQIKAERKMSRPSAKRVVKEDLEQLFKRAKSTVGKEIRKAKRAAARKSSLKLDKEMGQRRHMVL